MDASRESDEQLPCQARALLTERVIGRYDRVEMLGRNSLAGLGLALAVASSCSENADTSGGMGGRRSSGGTAGSFGSGASAGSSFGGSGGFGASGGSSGTGAVAGNSGNGAQGGADGGLDASNTSGGSGGTGGTAGSPAVLIQPIKRGEDYVLEFEGIRFVVVPAGGRVIEFSLAYFDMLNASDAVNFGSTLWSSPQNPDWGWPPPAALDSATYTVEVLGNTISMTSGVAAFSNHRIRAIKRFSPDLDARAIVIEYSLENASSTNDSFAPWEVTRVNPNGLSFFPSTSSASGPLAGSATTVGGHTWFNHTPPSTQGQKLYADGAATWIAHTDRTRLFIKQWTDVPPNQQAPSEAEVEIYDGTSYVELEAQGAYASVGPGTAASFTVRWYLQSLPPGTNVAVGSSTLISAVQAILG